MPIIVTKDKGVPRRLYGFREDEPRPKPKASDFVDPSVDPRVETTSPDEVIPDEEAAYAPEETELAPYTEPSVVDSPAGSDEMVSSTQETIQRSVSMAAMLSLPFFAYLTFSNRLPAWARVVSGMLGGGILLGEGGLLQTWSAKDAGEEPLFQGYPRRRRLKGFSTPFGEITFSGQRGLGDCGCGCGGKPGGCGG